jgi:predicted nucleic-acid-binding protein
MATPESNHARAEQQKIMIALDTNALVRLLIVDDSAQTAAARKLAESHRVLVLRTVLLETEWLLRGRFGLERDRILRFFLGLAETENMVLEDELSLRRALDWYGKGLDFADAMHLASAGETPLHTFDARFAKRAGKFGAPVRLIKTR